MNEQGGNRVLIVDDDPAVLQVYGRVLARVGHRCTEVSDPHEVLGFLRNSPDYGVVITDLNMPGLGGVELMRLVREQFPERSWLQLIVITGNASLESAIDSLRLDATEYLQKPVSATDLTRAVSRAALRAEASRLLGASISRGEYLERLKEVAAVAGQLVGQIRGLDAPPPPASPEARSAPEALDGEVEGGECDSGGDDMRPVASKGATLKFIWQLQETRREVFRGSTLPESSWDILTELMSLELSGKRISVSGLCLAANCPVTTALRRIDELTDLGLIVKDPDPADARRLYVRMTEVGRSKMEEFLNQVARGLAPT